MHNHRWNFSWTKPRVDKLEQLWSDGFSASQIAPELDARLSRNAVIGKLHRLGLSGRGLPTQPQPPRRRTYAKRALRPVDAPVKIENPINVVALSKGYRIDELTARTCKWMAGDPKQGGTYCGHDTQPGSPYCGYHHGRAHYKGSQADFDRIAEKLLGKVPDDGRIFAVEAA